MLERFSHIINDPRWNGRVFVLHSHRPDGTNLLALGVEDAFVSTESTRDLPERLSVWIQSSADWKFGFIGYDVKNSIENLESTHPDRTGFPFVHFIRPQVVIRFSGPSWSIEKNTSGLDKDWFSEQLAAERVPPASQPAINLQPVMNRSEYIHAVRELKRHIARGDIYEVNFCQEFYSDKKLSDPYSTWLALNGVTNAPFSAYVRCNDHYVLCASPERFLQRRGSRILSQPIKGTIRRGKNAAEDEELKQELFTSEKERSENVMIVDLVRNDLSRIAERGSVKVDELFGIHTFNPVHHMISTISAEVRSGISFGDILRALFPMGSMTGAPKVRAMQLIEQYERSRRGLYSGTIGYMDPSGDFDFNVVIRSLLYNDKNPYLSCSVGSAITSLCDPDKEYAECLLKAEAIMRVLAL